MRLLTYFLSTLLIALPLTTQAVGTVQNFITSTAEFLTNTIIPFLLTIAFVVFVYNAFRFFVLGGGSEESQKAAKNLAIYSVMAFVVIIIFWGIVNLFVGTIGLGQATGIPSDYD